MPEVAVKENSFSAGKGGMHVESLTALMDEYHSCSPAEPEDIIRVLEERRREGRLHTETERWCSVSGPESGWPSSVSRWFAGGSLGMMIAGRR